MSLFALSKYPGVRLDEGLYLFQTVGEKESNKSVA
jgi:hypothetical protein